MKVTVHAPAKLNLTLDVVGTRPDGYHLLESLMQTVDITDTLTAQTAENIRLDAPGLCPPEKNTAYRAAQAFFAHTGMAGGVYMTLQKRIPTKAGMGGGSADAAAVLWALDRLYNTHLSVEELCRIGLMVGADVPFCVQGGAAYVTGIGEELRPLPCLPACSFVVAQPPEGVSTAAAYAAIDSHPLLRRPDHTRAIPAWEQGDLPAVCQQVCNVFELATALPGVKAIREIMETYAPLASQMTGSGSAVFAVFTDPAAADACRQALAKRFPVALLCRPCDGCRIEIE
ncbi:MAG: 4-(cytidine 5'-diphospho)-2-C-methyl-D-erythritol kinase [Ruminococcaceae bacterium]|nr:4-(cytidine 5'-diphospho)-2-C-methyl-D-erythritol kinase [Oscillospiraceae bacterium]